MSLNVLDIKPHFHINLLCFYPGMPLSLYLPGRNKGSILYFSAGGQTLPSKQQWALRCGTLPVQAGICEYYRMTLFWDVIAGISVPV